MRPFDLQLRTRVVFGDGSLERLGALARELRFARTLIVADRGIAESGMVDRAAAQLDAADIASFRFHDFDAKERRLRGRAVRHTARPLGRRQR